MRSRSCDVHTQKEAALSEDGSRTRALVFDLTPRQPSFLHPLLYIRAYSNSQSLRTTARVEPQHVRKRRSSIAQDMAGSFKSRLRLSACRVRPRERRRHNANPCFAVGPVNQNRSSRQGKLFGSHNFLSCSNPTPLST
jgi:hypothetical protein